jgi:phosphatidylglycerol lysyltransferase
MIVIGTTHHHKLSKQDFLNNKIQHQLLSMSTPHQDRLKLWTVTLMTALVGVMNLISAVTPSLSERSHWLHHIVPFEIRNRGHISAALIGFLMLTLAINLRRRKRNAWLLTIFFAIISIVSHLIKGWDYEEAIISGILLLLLLWMPKLFTARSDPPSIGQGLRVLMGAMLFTLAYGTAGFLILNGRFLLHHQPIYFQVTSAAQQTLAMFLTEDNAGLAGNNNFSRFFINSIYSISVGTIAYGVGMLLRPVLLRGQPASKVDRQQAKQIINQQGQTALARLALLLDKSYYFSPTGQTVVAYVPKGRVAVALGTPIGQEQDRAAAIASFRQYCDRNDWYPAFYQVPAHSLEQYHQLYFRSIQIGEEAIIDLDKFSLKGKANQNLRTAMNRLTKEGYRVQIYEPPINTHILQQLKPISDEWLSSQQGAEKKFSVGWFNLDYLQQYLVAVVYNPQQQPVAFANLVGGYNQPEVTVDLMRSRRELPNGTMDFLFVSVFQYLQAQKYERFSFGLSLFAEVGEGENAPRQEKSLRYLARHLNQFYNFRGLHSFKEKFRPEWEPRYLVYPRLAALPDVVVGLIRADSGDRLLDYIKPDF